jgi:hypothetical protein
MDGHLFSGAPANSRTAHAARKHMLPMPYIACCMLHGAMVHAAPFAGSVDKTIRIWNVASGPPVLLRCFA